LRHILPARFDTENDLVDFLAAPGPKDVEAAAASDGPLVILGAGGKMGPTLAVRAARARAAAGCKEPVFAVSRYSDQATHDWITAAGVRTIVAELTDPQTYPQLPDAPDVIFMAARKFGTGADAALTWTTNAFIPGLAADRYRDSRIVAFSTGNVYPLVPVGSGGATEETPLNPVGEYAWSALARERVFQSFSLRFGTPILILRLNYAVELRYGVLTDLAQRIVSGTPIDLAMGAVNVIWQGDANSICLRSFALASSPPAVLNLTGPGSLSVRWLAEELGKRLNIEPHFLGTERDNALLNDATRALNRFGPLQVDVESVLDWVADWVLRWGATFDKPTHFEVRDGQF